MIRAPLVNLIDRLSPDVSRLPRLDAAPREEILPPSLPGFSLYSSSGPFSSYRRGFNPALLYSTDSH